MADVGHTFAYNNHSVTIYYYLTSLTLKMTIFLFFDSGFSQKYLLLLLLFKDIGIRVWKYKAKKDLAQNKNVSKFIQCFSVHFCR